MKFLIRWFWSKLRLFNLERPPIFKMIMIETVITSITMPNRSSLGAISACIGPVCGAWRKFCGFEATMRHYEDEFICSKTAFCFLNIWLPDIAQKCFCIQNLRMDLSFQKKNDLKIWYLVVEILSRNLFLLFLEHPVGIWEFMDMTFRGIGDSGIWRLTFVGDRTYIRM